SFYNIVLQGEATLDPHPLLQFLKTIEQTLGRQQTVRYGPRPIDLDILSYADHQLDTPDLIIPHPRIAERAFVLVPFAEIAPNLQLPGQTVDIATLAARLQGQGHGEIIKVVPEEIHLDENRS
ncbi:MAG: 2-amino-4-hydroxy-6-hydroxymethyldihydropteridine diphosphokinase, partial [Chloroflexota bacterium]